MKRIWKTLYFILLLIQGISLSAQDLTFNDSLKLLYDTPAYILKQVEINEVDVRKTIDALPSFAVYKDLYFTTGVPLNKVINNNTADATFQISIRQRLTKSYLPFSTFAYLTYTQKSFWDIYAESAPFRDNNYNPGLGLGRYIIKDNKLLGATFIQMEHESNGKSGDDSRSWNYVSFSIKYFFNPRLTLGLKAWMPFVDGENNKDLLDYRGLTAASVNYLSKDNNWWVAAEMNPNKKWQSMNTIVSVAYRASKSHNQYLFARFVSGRAESLLDYKEYDINFRIGICIKPNFFSVY